MLRVCPTKFCFEEIRASFSFFELQLTRNEDKDVDERFELKYASELIDRCVKSRPCGMRFLKCALPLQGKTLLGLFCIFRVLSRFTQFIQPNGCVSRCQEAPCGMFLKWSTKLDSRYRCEHAPYVLRLLNALEL